MKIPARAVLPLAPLISLKTSLRGAQDVTSKSALSVVDAASAASTCEWFTQPVDHKNETLGTWQQLYCVNPQWWAGPGSPVVIMTPGEVSILTAINSARGYTYLDNTTLTGAYAQALGAAVVVLERKCCRELRH